MTVSELINEVLIRKKISLKQMADTQNVSLTLLSNVKNENKPGTWRAILAAIDAGGLHVEDCLTMPPDPLKTGENERALHLVKQALAHSGGDRDRVLELAETLEARHAKKRKVEVESPGSAVGKR